MKSWARKQIKEATSNGREKNTRHNDSVKNANMECVACDGTLGASQDSYFNSRASLRITHYRTRLADPGGASSKALIDGLVLCGVLRDDSIEWISEPIIETQIKVKNKSDEKTVVIITED